MARTVDAAIRTQLVERGVDYVCTHGLAGLSLRPLADAIGSSPSLLLYHFGSKDALIVEIIRAGRARQQAMVSDSALAGLSDADAARMLWSAWSSPLWEPLVRLFFEVYALALQDRSRFPGFLEHAVDDWLKALQPNGATPRDRAHATMMLASFRGFLLDLCATGDRARIDRAVDLFLHLCGEAA
jgi:AcrR family transcriptional regulator